ncbi:MAG TPA: hypothetical protein VFS02_24605 [Telluria sp.]|nr:hypothetical protein [Telluria sp.]
MKPDLADDFNALAQNRPRPCGDADTPGAPPARWQLDRTECAWQDRLMVRRWSATGSMLPGDCISPQARWWAWGRGSKPLAWRTAWTARSVGDGSGEEKRIVMIRRDSGGEWHAAEWRWKPSPRAATRRWQEGRWKLLEELADAVNHDTVAPLAAETGLLQSVWEGNLGTRPGEITGDLWRWQVEGLCLRSDPVGLGPQQFHLPYSVDDTRLEQRAAMQLQLARRYPKATWLTPFRLVPAAAGAQGGAQFQAVWVENGELKGQLWMPTKGNGPVVRLRIVASVRGASPAAVARAGQVIEHELAALAASWAARHE